jgi:hypothetical protein
MISNRFLSYCRPFSFDHILLGQSFSGQRLIQVQSAFSFRHWRNFYADIPKTIPSFKFNAGNLSFVILLQYVQNELKASDCKSRIDSFNTVSPASLLNSMPSNFLLFRLAGIAYSPNATKAKPEQAMIYVALGIRQTFQMHPMELPNRRKVMQWELLDLISHFVCVEFFKSETVITFLPPTIGGYKVISLSV